MAKWDYVVILKGIIGQGKYQDKYMTRAISDEMINGMKQYPKSELKGELAYRNARYQPIKFKDLSSLPWYNDKVDIVN